MQSKCRGFLIWHRKHQMHWKNILQNVKRQVPVYFLTTGNLHNNYMRKAADKSGHGKKTESPAMFTATWHTNGLSWDSSCIQARKLRKNLPVMKDIKDISQNHNGDLPENRFLNNTRLMKNIWHFFQMMKLYKSILKHFYPDNTKCIPVNVWGNYIHHRISDGSAPLHCPWRISACNPYSSVSSYRRNFCRISGRIKCAGTDYHYPDFVQSF